MSRPSPPEPRPALRKAPDGSVHPASAVLSSLAVQIPAASDADSSATGAATTSAMEKPARRGSPEDGPTRSRTAKKGKKGKAKKAAKPDPVELVALQVQLPKPVRKALRKRASEYGWTSEEAAAHVLRVRADDRR